MLEYGRLSWETQNQISIMVQGTADEKTWEMCEKCLLKYNWHWCIQYIGTIQSHAAIKMTSFTARHGYQIKSHSACATVVLKTQNGCAWLAILQFRFVIYWKCMAHLEKKKHNNDHWPLSSWGFVLSIKLVYSISRWLNSIKGKVDVKWCKTCPCLNLFLCVLYASK